MVEEISIQKVPLPTKVYQSVNENISNLKVDNKFEDNFPLLV
jgi:hypothetical protein